MLLKKVEMKIWYFEGFQVRLVEIKGSRAVRGDQRNVGNYNFKRQAKNNLTVKEFIGARLKKFEQYGWTVQVSSVTAQRLTTIHRWRVSGLPIPSSKKFHPNEAVQHFTAKYAPNDPAMGVSYLLRRG